MIGVKRKSLKSRTYAILRLFLDLRRPVTERKRSIWSGENRHGPEVIGKFRRVSPCIGKRDRTPVQALGTGVIAQDQRTPGRRSHLGRLWLHQATPRIAFHRDMDDHVRNHRTCESGWSRRRVGGTSGRRLRRETLFGCATNGGFTPLSRRITVGRTRARGNTFTERRCLAVVGGIVIGFGTVFVIGHVTKKATLVQLLDIVRHPETVQKP